ncbi:multisubunit potassium/proton antiporter, PhaG subunit [Nitrosomonas eutropha]|uniref:monovalent cation/H(+) antiporter subunit G n=1 Tax=Nitrosomonas TaxID=914 RepID=UPI000886F92B|nr:MULTISPECIES: monovalent cation/H(+) antiporter subunit G [Nitrosomonas]MXS79322.1 cation:proton antiporter [Nitrosomonas sp. GH22]SCX22736.1 multisubunit potassium/proton antiporter, PhaG subunit [Nitrosomonas eutropha]SDW91890.1 multisubunit potassium/proton antiporter, PhaG subunit [Nitrosomonas eutropha]
MNQASDLPLWAALLIAIFLLIGAGLTLIGSFGLYRLRSFYDRIHAPTLGTSWGTAGIVIASIVYFSVVESRLILHHLLIGAFVTVTTPVTLILLSRAALYRDRAENGPDIPLLDPPNNPSEVSSTEKESADSHNNTHTIEK